MPTLSYHTVKHWVKNSDHPLAKNAHTIHYKIKVFNFPMPIMMAIFLYKSYSTLGTLINTISRIIFYTPMFKSQTEYCGGKLYLYGGLPYISGPLRMKIGENCRISGKTTLTARYSKNIQPQLIVGNNVDIGWQSTIAVGRTVTLGDNVRIAGSCFIAGYPGHPLDTINRANGLPDTDDQAKSIVLQDDVWIGTGVTIIAGVNIGKSTIVAAGSVVTKSLPSNVLAGGNPAKVLRVLPNSSEVSQ